MGGVKKTVDKITSKKVLKDRFAPNPFKKDEMEKSFQNPVEILSESADDLGGAFTPEIPEEEEATIIPLPDESSAQLRARKKRAQAKTSGRSSTILTEGLGG